ncbi:MAG: type II secretion system secretin GspD [Methyloprofundus sp.]|nr:type II secretion system secretin GspD [Methyloprofundus sp.]
MTNFVKKFSISLLTILFFSAFNPIKAEESITLNFVDADIRSVIATVSKETGKNFLVDPRVKGKFTIYSATPVSESALYEVFISALRTHGYAAIEQDDIFHIVPLMQAKQSPTSVSTSNPTKSSAKQITQVIKINNISAVKLIPVLRPLMPKEGYIAAYASTNLIILSDSEKNIARLRQIINSMDTPSNNQIDIIPLIKADANQILKTIKSMLPKKVGSTAIHLSVDSRTNSILLSGDSIERMRLKNIISKLDSPVQTNSSHHVIYLKHASAAELAPILDKIISAEEKNSTKTKVKSSIIADEATNSIIISAELNAYRSLSNIIDQLDIPRTQVMIEAIIAEVSLDGSNELGVEWAFAGGNDNVKGAASSKNTGSILSTLNEVANGDLAKAAATAAAGGGFTGLIANDNFGVLLNALQGNSDFNILSAPKILTIANKEAEIIVGENVPFVTGSYTQSNEGSTNPFQTVKREDIGLKLRIKPQINVSGRIGLEIFQEISTVKNSTTAVDLITTKRSINSNVLINDGKILALGGLMDDAVIDSNTGIPWLMDIPYLGWLFQSHSTKITKRTLMVFIKPTILKNQKTSDAMTDVFFDAVNKEQLKFNDKPLLITPASWDYKLPTTEGGKLNFDITPEPAATDSQSLQ